MVIMDCNSFSDNAKQKATLVGFVAVSFWYSQPFSVAADQWDP